VFAGAVTEFVAREAKRRTAASCQRVRGASKRRNNVVKDTYLHEYDPSGGEHEMSGVRKKSGQWSFERKV
jgi:hypothetical protein